MQIEATGESAEPEYKFEALVTLDKVSWRFISTMVVKRLSFVQVELKDGEEDEDILFDV